jgi:hypothetical protein
MVVPSYIRNRNTIFESFNISGSSTKELKRKYVYPDSLLRYDKRIIIWG